MHYGEFNHQIRCTYCGNDNLHQAEYEVWDRDEDSDTGFHVMTSRAGVNVNSDMRKCPSSRRDGFAISFYCEHCPDISRLYIIQHKGTTYVEFKGCEVVKV